MSKEKYVLEKGFYTGIDSSPNPTKEQIFKLGLKQGAIEELRRVERVFSGYEIVKVEAESIINYVNNRLKVLEKGVLK